LTGVPGVAIKNGCGLVGVPGSGVGADTFGYLYLLKGSSSYEFWRYDLSSSAWSPMPNAPAGASNRPFSIGSCLATDGVSIYALKGGYNEFFQYKIAKDSWTTLTSLPLIGAGGKKKKSGDGAALAYLDDAVYALKGNNTGEFWEFSGGNWTLGDNVPTGTGKFVKGGGALASGGYELYALKGNSTLEYYGYFPSIAALAQAPAKRGDNRPACNIIHKVAVTRILSPWQDPVGTITTEPVKAQIANLTPHPDCFMAFATITDRQGVQVYLDSAVVSGISPMESLAVCFKDWSGPRDAGLYTLRCSVGIKGDPNHANDTMSTLVPVVRDGAGSGWLTSLPYMPSGKKNKTVNDGGALACNVEGSASYVYGLKGNNTTEFYQYNPGTNVWATAESIPWIGASGKKKGAKAGAAIAGLRGKIYAVKGNGVSDFFQYNPTVPSGSRWSKMTSVPGVPIKNGCGIVSIPPSGVAADTFGWLYLLKGSSSLEFWRYDCSKSAWTQMASAPAGTSGRPFAIGSCLATDGANIYALKGGYNEFYQYDIATNVWTTLTALPLVGNGGKKKKSGDGAALAYLSSAVYALKGNNTNEFWEFANQAWTQGANVPAGTGKFVKGGGALAASNLQLYALKGNNTLEFYGYVPSSMAPALAPTTRIDGVQESRITAPAGYHLSITPNPFRGATRINYSLPRAGHASVKLYDMAGALKAVLADGYSAAGAHIISVDASRLARGIYIVKFASADYGTTTKLILE
jgi:hypothetical protein